MLAQDALLRRSKTAKITEMTNLDSASASPQQAHDKVEKSESSHGPVMGFPAQGWKTYTDNLMNLFDKIKQIPEKGGVEAPGVADAVRSARIKLMPV